MIVLHCRKPRFLSFPVSPPIYRSKSAKFQLCITARRIIIFGQTAPGHICSLFFLFLNPDAEIMLTLLFNTLLTITPHNTQKRRRRKERTTYGPLRRYSRWVTHPVRNPDRQGLTSHFANYRFPFRKLQIFISQTTDSHFVSFHFVSFRFHVFLLFSAYY